MKQTYAGRRRTHPYAPSPATSPSKSSFDSEQRRPFRTLTSVRANSTRIRDSKSQPKKKPALNSAKTLTLSQLHFDAAKTLKACQICNLSYTIGAPDDERLHKMHCLRVSKGLDWGKDEEKDGGKASLRIIEDMKSIKGGSEMGRIVAVDCHAGGKIGAKVSLVLEMVNTSLSAPPLSRKALEASRAYLFLVPVSNASRERIVGVVVATRIEKAMRVVHEDNCGLDAGDLVIVDGGLFCDPSPVATPMGIARLFVSLKYRRRGIASALLTAATNTFIHGCPLEVEKGQVAFSQPTGLGKAIMTSWGKGHCRIYEE